MLTFNDARSSIRPIHLVEPAAEAILADRLRVIRQELPTVDVALFQLGLQAVRTVPL